MAYGIVVFDDGSNFTSNHYVCPVTGVYHFDAGILWQPFALSGALASIALQVGGSIPAETSMTTFGGFFSNVVSATVKCNAGTVVQVLAAHGSSGAQVISSSTAVTYFSGHLVY